MTIFSLEVFPPKRTAPVGTIYDTLDGLTGLSPHFISVTYGTGKSADRTATARIAHTVRAEYGIPAVAHLTAQYLTEDSAEEALAMFDEAKVAGVLALRGDRNPDREPAGVFHYANELTAFIRERRPDMKIYGACYPEKHPQADTLDHDIDNLKRKVDAGVTHLISQLFYDNSDFLRFLDKARAAASPYRSKRASCHRSTHAPYATWPACAPRRSPNGSPHCSTIGKTTRTR